MLGQALDQALGDRARDPPLRPRRRADGRGARGVRDRPLRPAVLRAVGARRCRPAAIGGFEHELDRGVLPRGGERRARLTLHVDVEAGTNAHHMIEACFKAFARALRAAVAIDPDETGVPVDEGDADVTRRDRRLRDGQPPQRREGARARRRAPSRGPPTTTSSARADGIVVPGVGAFPEAMRRLRALGLDELCASARRGRAGARALPRHAAAVRRARRSTRAPTGSASSRAPWSQLEAPGLKLPHIGWNPSPSRATAADRGPRRGGGLLPRALLRCPARGRRATSSAAASTASRSSSIVERGNVLGAQFHPEKSSRDGLRAAAQLRRACAAAVA